MGTCCYNVRNNGIVCSQKYTLYLDYLLVTTHTFEFKHIFLRDKYGI
jgi:hypothetical protein